MFSIRDTFNQFLVGYYNRHYLALLVLYQDSKTEPIAALLPQFVPIIPCPPLTFHFVVAPELRP